ncbi:MAG: hypothetical protein JSW39_29545 [Desulfobacterales bacterium]|nr:MAG: hypothetical protein JSW39_29545 [Desulfobacterales bacterium]
MQTHLIKIIALFFCFLGGALCNPPAQAHVLQGPHILELMTARLGQAKSLYVSQKVLFYQMGPMEDVPGLDEKNPFARTVAPERTTAAIRSAAARDDPRGKEVRRESLRYLFPGAFRSDLNSKNGERIHVSVDGESLTVVDGSIVPTAPTRFDLYKDLLLLRSRKILVERLSLLGVDVSVSSLGRFEGHVVFVVGAIYPDESVPQLWIDKNTLQPIRWIITGRNQETSSEPFEIRYFEWRPMGNIWYPRRIEFIQGDQLVRELQSEKYELNPTLATELFDIARLKKVYRASSPGPTRPRESKGMSEVQKTIEEFRRIFE